MWGYVLKHEAQFRNEFHIPPGGVDSNAPSSSGNPTSGGPETPSPRGDAPDFEHDLVTRTSHSGSFIQLGVGVRVSEATGFVHSEVIKFDHGICGGLMWNAYFFRFAYSERVGIYTANQRISEVFESSLLLLLPLSCLVFSCLFLSFLFF